MSMASIVTNVIKVGTMATKFGVQKDIERGDPPEPTGKKVPMIVYCIAAAAASIAIDKLMVELQAQVDNLQKHLDKKQEDFEKKLAEGEESERWLARKAARLRKLSDDITNWQESFNYYTSTAYLQMVIEEKAEQYRSQIFIALAPVAAIAGIPRFLSELLGYLSAGSKACYDEVLSAIPRDLIPPVAPDIDILTVNVHNNELNLAMTPEGNDRYSITATVRDEVGNIIDPEVAGTDLSWISSNPSVARPFPSEGSESLIRAYSVGNCVITVFYQIEQDEIDDEPTGPTSRVERFTVEVVQRGDRRGRIEPPTRRDPRGPRDDNESGCRDSQGYSVECNDPDCFSGPCTEPREGDCYDIDGFAVDCNDPECTRGPCV